LKLLHLISEKPPVKSGFSRAIARLAEELTKMGHEVDVLSAQDCYLKFIGEIKLVINTVKIKRLLRDDYDIVHVHGHTPLFSDRLFLASKLLSKKVVYTLHCLVNYYLKPVSTLYNAIFNNLMLKIADAVIVTSKSYYKMLYKFTRKYLVPWGVDYDKFSGVRVPHDGYRLLFVGQMRPYKGLKVLLEAVKGLDAELWVVGDGPDRFKYEDYAQRLKLNSVRFYGAVPDDVLKRMYLSSDVLVLPSISKNEAFGLVTLEAAAAGCAVVASDLPGLRDVVEDFGLLVKPKDPHGLREALLTLKDSSVRAKYAGMGKKAVMKYSWSSVAEEYVNIYNAVLSGK